MIIHIIIIVFVICVVLYALYKQYEHDTYKELFYNIPTPFRRPQLNINNHCNKDLSIPRSQQAQQFTKTKNSCVNNWDNTYYVGDKNLYFNSQQDVYVPPPSGSSVKRKRYPSIHDYLTSLFATELCKENKSKIKNLVSNRLYELDANAKVRSNKSFYDGKQKTYENSYESLNDNFNQFLDNVVNDNISLKELINDPELFIKDIKYLYDNDKTLLLQDL